MDRIKILLADPHELFREGLRRIINEEEDIACITAIANTESLLNAFSEFKLDVALIDCSISENTPELIRFLKSKYDTTLIVLTHSINTSEVQSCFQAGVDGYLTKDVTQSQLINAIRTVHDGEQVLCPAARLCISRIFPKKGETKIGTCWLTNRELEVARKVGEGMTNKEIAMELNITEHTVASHLINTFRKLEVKSRTEAVIKCMERGWIVVDGHTES